MKAHLPTTLTPVQHVLIHGVIMMMAAGTLALGIHFSHIHAEVVGSIALAIEFIQMIKIPKENR